MIGLNADHFFRMTDDTGILKFSRYGVPDPKSGYVTADNARALIAAVMLYAQFKEKKYENLIYRFTSFILNSQKEDGRFYPFMTYERRFVEEESVETTFGICLWALGHTISSSHVVPGIKKLCRQMLEQAIPHLGTLEAPRAKAYAIKGLCCVARDMELQPEIEELADTLVRQFKLYSYDGWNWFDDVLTYGDAVLPWSCFKAYKVLRNPDYIKIALDSLEFLTEFTVHTEGYYKPIGTNGWMSRGQRPAEFDEMPVDAAISALTYLEAFYLFKEIKYLEKAKLCLSWFNGQNSHKIAMLDQDTGGVYDAITAEGVNQDQGAESLLSYLIVVLSMNRFINQ